MVTRRSLLKGLVTGALATALPLVKSIPLAPGFKRKRVVVSPDGTGDARTISEGLSMLPPDGGEVLLRGGLYCNEDIVVPKGVSIIVEEGEITIANCCFSMTSGDIIFQNLKIALDENFRIV